MEQQPNPSSSRSDKELADVSSERAQLIGTDPENSRPSVGDGNSPAWKLRVVNLTGFSLALLLTIIVGFYSFKNGVTLFSFHPIAMTIGWMVLMPMAINSLRYGDLMTSWMPLQPRSTRHWVLQAAAATCVTSGFIVIVINKIKLDKYHFVSYHAIFGLAAFVWMFLSIFKGIAALFSIKLKEYIPPVYVKLFHGIVGILSLTLGTITLVLGLVSPIITDLPMQWLCSFLAVIICVLTGLRPSITMYVRMRERLGYHH